MHLLVRLLRLPVDINVTEQLHATYWPILQPNVHVSVAVHAIKELITNRIVSVIGDNSTQRHFRCSQFARLYLPFLVVTSLLLTYHVIIILMLLMEYSFSFWIIWERNNFIERWFNRLIVIRFYHIKVIRLHDVILFMICAYIVKFVSSCCCFGSAVT